jgi:hypothetical protein
MVSRGLTASLRTALSPTLKSPTRIGSRAAIIASVCLLACDEAGRLPEGFDLAEPLADTNPPETSADVAEVHSSDTHVGVDTGPEASDAELEDTGDVPTTGDGGDSDVTDEVSPESDLVLPTFTLEPARQTVLASGRVTWLSVTGPQRIAMVRDGELEVFTSSGSSSLGPPPSGLRTATEFEGRLLVSTDEAVLVEDDGELVPSPLGEVIDGPALAFVVDGESLWLSTRSALHRVVDGAMRTIRVPGLDLASPLLARGVAPQGGLWVGSRDGVISLSPVGEGLSATLVSPRAPSALGVDALGQVWILSSGRVHRRASGGDASWQTFGLEPTPDLILAAPESAHVWLVGDGVLFHAVDGNWARVEPAPPRALAYAVRPDGTLLIGSGNGLSAISPGRLISLSGLRPRATLEGPTVIEIRVSDPELATIEAAVDGTSRATTLEGEGSGRAFRLTLEPTSLSRGLHTLEVTATYGDDGTRLAASLQFEVMYVTWQDEIEPLFEARCSNCHNDVAGASTAILTSPESWESRFDCILCRVIVPIDPSSPECRACDDFASQMPPGGKLSDTDIDHLRRWRLEGFRKE